ncbi:MAG: hypothetical protein A3F90_11735 [Deltaproteobacteria bacterium RIFCSPLOWO2_12_FULL_60_19]|nr:MAG: hypothetical protein A3F90_11735 [Deltaproteobacteria bacterium RIFCSPLOWO2_12_FULL_60_19]
MSLGNFFPARCRFVALFSKIVTRAILYPYIINTLLHGTAIAVDFPNYQPFQFRLLRNDSFHMIEAESMTLCFVSRLRNRAMGFRSHEAGKRKS